MKEKIVCIAFGTLATAGTKFFGGWTPTLSALLLMMGIDMVMGIVVAIFFKNSPKTKNGAASSNAMLKGLWKKFGMICIIAVAHQIDIVLAVNYVMIATIYGFIANETLSIVENAGLMGIVKSDVLISAVEVLKSKASKVE